MFYVKNLSGDVIAIHQSGLPGVPGVYDAVQQVLSPEDYFILFRGEQPLDSLPEEDEVIFIFFDRIEEEVLHFVEDASVLKKFVIKTPEQAEYFYCMYECEDNLARYFTDGSVIPLLNDTEDRYFYGIKANEFFSDQRELFSERVGKFPVHLRHYLSKRVNEEWCHKFASSVRDQSESVRDQPYGETELGRIF